MKQVCGQQNDLVRLLMLVCHMYHHSDLHGLFSMIVIWLSFTASAAGKRSIRTLYQKYNVV